MGCKEPVFLQENRVPSRMHMPELSRLRNTFLCACPGMLGLFVTATVLGKLPPQKAGMRMPTFASLCALCPLWTPSECQLLLQGLELKPFGYAACLEPAHPSMLHTPLSGLPACTACYARHDSPFQQTLSASKVETDTQTWPQ